MVSTARARARIALLTATAFLLAACAAPLGPLGARAAHATSPPSDLPTHLGIGLSGGPTTNGIYGWMPGSGVPWDYAYQYLAGGVNTGGGWETWNTNGQFATWYAQGAASHNYIPVFSYYELQQSNGSCGSCGEAQKDLSNLNNPGTMASYYQNFALLMKRLGTGTYDGIAGFGKTAIVHVEPDLSGFAEQAVLDNTRCVSYCTGQGNDPALLKAAVAGSGDPDVAGYPDTYQGFNRALLHLRDLYAPNVLLAFHVSDWATATDIGSSTSAALDATTLGQEAGAFAAASGIAGLPAGARGYDLLFNDVADRDAGYVKANWGVDTWWDVRNVAVPNFHRWETYIGAIHNTAGRPVMVWQIPLGNQYFDTENNTNGHYQDNRAEYFFGHMDELARAGIVGLLFGAGNGGSSVNTDAMNDSVTNPAPFCTGDGTSGGQVCNAHASTVSDDDGGYLRMAAGQYYASGAYPLDNSTGPVASTATPPTPTPAPPTPTPAPPTPAGVTFTVGGTTESSPSVAPGAAEAFTTTITASAAATDELVNFEVHDPAFNKIWQTWQSPVSFTGGVPRTFSVSWSAPAGAAPGAYTLVVSVFTSDWSHMQAWSRAIQFTVSAPPPAPNMATPTDTATTTDRAIPTDTPTATATVTNTPVPTNTATNTATPTTRPSATNTATGTPIPSDTPTNTRVPSATATPVSTATDTPRPTNTATGTPPIIPPAATATGTPPGNTETNTPAPSATATAPGLPSTGTATATTRPAATATNTVPPATATRWPRTATPTSTRTSAPLAFGFGRTTESRAIVLPGTTQTFTATITSNKPASDELVDFEVHDPQDHLVWQTWQSPVSFTGGVPRTFTAAWPVARTAVSGTYTFKIGVFTADWSRLQAWDNSAITCTIPGTVTTLARPVYGARPHVVTVSARPHPVTGLSQVRGAHARPTRRQANHRVAHPATGHVHGHDKRQGAHPT